MKEKILMKIVSVLLAICLIFTGTTAVQIINAYATESESDFDESDDEYEIEFIPDFELEPDTQL